MVKTSSFKRLILRAVLRQVSPMVIRRFRRKTRSKVLHEFKLHRQEKFLYVCDTLHMWEWDIRVLDIQEGVEGDHAPVCVGGRGAAPPEFCGGPGLVRYQRQRM
jgi:hypothetical protein